MMGAMSTNLILMGGLRFLIQTLVVIQNSNKLSREGKSTILDSAWKEV
jgi:hypothetical protein